MLRKLTYAAVLTLAAGAASAEECTAITVEDAFDLTEEQIGVLYTCLQEKMATGDQRDKNSLDDHVLTDHHGRDSFADILNKAGCTFRDSVFCLVNVG